MVQRDSPTLRSRTLEVTAIGVTDLTAAEGLGVQAWS